ncbi:MAG: cysteate synthase [Spirochaetes bacterium]|nr:cysteate synthase [Spirochaetota bacterium]
MTTSPATRPSVAPEETGFRLHYDLECLATGTVLEDTFSPEQGMVLTNAASQEPAFLRTRYRTEQITPGPAEEGLYRFADWLPIRRRLAGSSAPVTYRSEALGRALDMDRLYVTFSGYWPERKVFMKSGTFKECEAYSVGGRLPADNTSILVVASAGNTARAFARVFTENKMPLLLVVPERNLPALWHAGERPQSVRILAVGGRSDYCDAIAVASQVAQLPGFIAEGGAANVARRDGMGTTVLSAATEIGELPEVYVQAIGSGTGAIAAWEASLRLLEDGRFGNRPMRLVVSQNKPFVPIHRSWERRLPTLISMSDGRARRQIRALYADVLANRKPPYSVRGGLFDALVDSRGRSHAISRHEAQTARSLFAGTEGIDIAHPAAVALASLRRARREGTVGKDTLTMINITGGGADRFHTEYTSKIPAADAVVHGDRISPDELEDTVRKLFEE